MVSDPWWNWVEEVRKWLAAVVLQRPPHEDVVIPKRYVPHPAEMGFRRSLGEPRGQLADYRLALPDGRSIHLREYEDRYEAHWDWVDPEVDPLGHLIYDAPHWLIIGGMAILALMLMTRHEGGRRQDRRL